MKKHLFAWAILTISYSLTAQNNLPSENWHHSNPNTSETYGISTEDTYETLLKGKSSSTVIVAIIDSGVDFDHEDLAPVMWVNPGEIPDNNIDDDKNGYVDDIHGWNFIGGKDGRNIGSETLEVTRLYNRYKDKYEAPRSSPLSKDEIEEYKLFLKCEAEIKESREAAQKNLESIDERKTYFINAINALEESVDGTQLEYSNLDSLSSIVEGEAKVALNILKQSVDPKEDIPSFDEIRSTIAEQMESRKNRYTTELDYYYNTEFNGRSEIIGDDDMNYDEKYYGNNDIEGPDADHGTHVAGTIAAVRNNDIGMNGIADNVRIMSIRTVPDGDERDKDVANAIRYAVDNGATIINMSFGKGYSWNKDIVDDAVHYADKNDVLIVNSAGNSAQNTDEIVSYPNDKYNKKKGGFLFFGKKRYPENYISVGALSYEKGENAPAWFSNYGKETVDIFSPGVMIYAPIPGDKYRRMNGTSMASPVVAGVATVLRSYFPTLTAKQVKNILMESVSPMDIEVKIPRTETKVKFSEICKSGGVVSMKNAVSLALKTKGKKKVKKSKNIVGPSPRA